jgi:hypothetical protein
MAELLTKRVKPEKSYLTLLLFRNGFSKQTNISAFFPIAKVIVGYRRRKGSWETS